MNNINFNEILRYLNMFKRSSYIVEYIVEKIFLNDEVYTYIKRFSIIL